MPDKKNDVKRNRKNSFKNGDGRMLDLTQLIRGELDQLSVNSGGQSSGKRIRKQKSKRPDSKQRVRCELDLSDSNPPQKDLGEQKLNRGSSLRSFDSPQSQIVKSRKRTGERKSKPRSIPREEPIQKKVPGKQDLNIMEGEPNQMSQPTNSALRSRKSKPRQKANPESILYEGKACLQTERKCGERALEDEDINQSPRYTTRKESVVLVVHNEEDFKRIPRRLEPMPKQRKSRSEKKRRPASEKSLSNKKTPQQISNPTDVAGRQTPVEKSRSDISATMAVIPKIEQLGSCEYTRYPSPPRHKPNEETRRKVKYRTSGHGDNACLQQNGGRDGSMEGIKYRSHSVPKDAHLSHGDLLKQIPTPQQVEPMSVHSLGSVVEDMQAKKDQSQVEIVKQFELKDVSLKPSANTQQDLHTEPKIKISATDSLDNSSPKKMKKRRKLPRQDQRQVEIVKQLELKDVSLKPSANAQQDPITLPNMKLSVKDNSDNSSPKKIKKRRKLPRQDKNVESSENVELTYVSPKPCRDAPQAEPDQKWEDKACISDSSTKKIEDLSNFKALDTQEASEQVDDVLEGSDLVLEEITQEIEASVTELDRKSNDKVCVNDSSIKKVKNLINLETRNTQDTPKTVDRELKDSDLVLEEITQEMEPNPVDDLDQKSKQVYIGNPPLKKIKNFPNLDMNITQETPKPADKVSDDSVLILEEITQEMETNPSDELDQKCKQDVYIGKPTMKKIKNLPNFEARSIQESPQHVDKLSRDSDLILEEFPQGMEASLTAQNVVNLSANTKHYAITEFKPEEKLNQKPVQQTKTLKKADGHTEAVSVIQTRPHVQMDAIVDSVLDKNTTHASEPVKSDECNSWDLSDDECDDLTKLPQLPVAGEKKLGPKQDKTDNKSKDDVDDDNFSELLNSIEEKLLRKTQLKERNAGKIPPTSTNPSAADSELESQTHVSNDVPNVEAASKERCDKGNHGGRSSPNASAEQDASDADPFDISDILKSDDEPKTAGKPNPDSENRADKKRDAETDSRDSQKQLESDEEIPKGEATILGILEFQMKMKGARGLRLEKMQERYQELMDEYKEIVNKKKQPYKESLCSWSSEIPKDTTDDDTDDQLSWGEPEPAKPRGMPCPGYDRMESDCKTACNSKGDLSLEGDGFEKAASHKHARKNERKFESVPGKDLKKALKKALKKIKDSDNSESLKTKEERELLKYQEKTERKRQRRLKKMNREEKKSQRRKVEEFLRAQDKEDKKQTRRERETEKKKARERKERERQESKERRKREKETKKELEERRDAERERRETRERIEKAATRRLKERQKREKRELRAAVDEEAEAKHVEIQQSLGRMEKKLMRDAEKRRRGPQMWLGLTDGSRAKKKRDGQNMKECFRPQDANSARRAWEWSNNPAKSSATDHPYERMRQQTGPAVPSNAEVSCTPVEPLQVFEHGDFEERLKATIKTGIEHVIAKQMVYSQGRKYKKSYASKHSSMDYFHTRLNIDTPSNVLQYRERIQLHEFLETCDKCKTSALKGWSVLWDYLHWFYPNLPGITCKIVPDIDIKSAIKKTKLSIDEYAAVTAAKVMEGLHQATVT